MAISLRPRARRIVVIANETLASPSVIDAVRRRAEDDDAEVALVVPALSSSRIAHVLTADVPRARARAEERLERSLGALAAAGVRACGEIGDADPLAALDDAIRLFAPLEIIIATHPPDRSHWLERRVVARARARYALPITHLVVDLEAGLDGVTGGAGRRAA
jgi:GABA permease